MKHGEETINPYAAGRYFGQYMQMSKNLAHVYSSEVLSESYLMNTNMTGLRWFFKNLCIHVLWKRVASTLEGFNRSNNKSQYMSVLYWLGMAPLKYSQYDTLTIFLTMLII